MIVDQDNPSLIPPSENSIVWRYMDTEKFISLLENEALFFCRADRFSDPFEGSVPRKEAEFRIKNFENVSRYYGSSYDIEKAQEQSDAIALFHKAYKRATVINCWQENNNESDAMWRIYLKSNKGLAVKSSVGSILKAFNETEDEVAISRVRYMDFENDIWYHEIDYPCRNYSFYAPFVHKRNEFKHESEIRLIHHVEDAIKDEKYWQSQKNKTGKFIKIDINILIEAIILPPTADNYIENEIRSIVKKYGVSKEIRRSRLQDEPIY